MTRTVSQLYADWRADRITDATYRAELSARGLAHQSEGSQPGYEGSFAESLAKHASYLRVPMTHAPSEVEFMSVLSYRVDQELAAAELRVASLKELQDRYSA
jgi:hypothetical protein